MTEFSIRVNGLGKKYRIGDSPDRYNTLRDTIVGAFKSPIRRIQRSLLPFGDGGSEDSNIIWALKDITFDVNQGQVVGVIGKNGAGKSTLLKILSRVTEPSAGEVEIRGRVGSLLEVGTGFHPELTGRENIFLNGAILGMRRSEIDKKFDEIVDFSGVEKFIDTPVKRYSSGMYLRLAFAVAAHLEPDILVVDEVLAVGDAEFQRKCLGKMNDVARQGRTVLFVSHNMSAILRLTQESIVLDRGNLILRGPTVKAVDYYMSAGLSKTGERSWDDDSVQKTFSPFIPKAVRVLDSGARISDTVRSTEPITIEIEYQLAEPIQGLRIGLYLLSMRGEFVFTSFDTDDAEKYEKFRIRGIGHYKSCCKIPADFLNEGRYAIGVNASAFRVKRYFQDERALTFTVDAVGAPGKQWPETRLGLIRPRLEWKIESVKM